jgi:hypothetical protein
MLNIIVDVIDESKWKNLKIHMEKLVCCGIIRTNVLFTEMNAVGIIGYEYID